MKYLNWLEIKNYYLIILDLPIIDKYKLFFKKLSRQFFNKLSYINKCVQGRKNLENGLMVKSAHIKK